MECVVAQTPVARTVQMRVDQLCLRLDVAAARRGDALAVLCGHGHAPRLVVALDIEPVAVGGGVVVRQPADLRDEVDIVAVLARPCAVDAEVAFLVLAAAVFVGRTAVQIAARDTDAPILARLLVVADLHGRILHAVIRAVLVA